MFTFETESWMQKWTLGEKNRHQLVLANRPRFFHQLTSFNKGIFVRKLV